MLFVQRRIRLNLDQACPLRGAFNDALRSWLDVRGSCHFYPGKAEETQTATPLQAFNTLIGVPKSKFSSEAKLVIRIGHKYAISDDMHSILTNLVEETIEKYKKQIDIVSPIERVNWRRWKLRMLDYVKPTSKRGNPRLVSNLHKSTKDLRALNVVLKQTDKNLGVVAIRGDI